MSSVSASSMLTYLILGFTTSAACRGELACAGIYSIVRGVGVEIWCGVRLEVKG